MKADWRTILRKRSAGQMSYYFSKKEEKMLGTSQAGNLGKNE